MLFELNDDVIDVLQDKIDGIVAANQEDDMDDGASYNLFDIEHEWGSNEHQDAIIIIARQLIKKWSLFDSSLHYDLSTLHSVDQVSLSVVSDSLVHSSLIMLQTVLQFFGTKGPQQENIDRS